MKRIIAFILVLIMLSTNCMSENMTVMASEKNTEKITLDKKQASMSAGDTMKLKVKSVSPKNASKSVKWKSSNKKIATVSASGKVKAKKNGTVTITATSKSNPKAAAKCKIKIYKATKKLQLMSQKSYTLDVGKTVSLKVNTSPKKGVQPVLWSSKNKKIAKVNSKGMVTAVSVGQTSITGKSGKKKVSVTIAVKKADSTTPENPTPENPTPENPTPENPTPENPTPENPTPENPTPENPTPENPTPENPTPENPTPENPTPENPTPENPTPEEPTPEEPTPSVESYSRAEWIAQLVDRMGYFITEESLEKDVETGEYIYSYDDISDNENAWKIEAAVHNGILPVEEDENGERNYLFMPEKEATREFAAMTAVHAAGYATDTALESSDSTELLYPMEDKAAVDAAMVELKDGAFCPQENLTGEEGEKILKVIDEIIADRVINPEHEDVLEYQDNVVVVEETPEMKDYTVGVSEERQQLAVTIPKTDETVDFKEGQILLLPASEEYPEGLPVKVSSVSSADGNSVVYGQLPKDMTEVFDKVDMESVGYIDEENIVLADGVKIVEEEGISAYGLRAGDIGFKKTLSVPLGGIETEGAEAGAELSLTIEIPEVEVRLDYEKKRVNELYVRVPNTITAAFDAHGGLSVSKELFRTPVKLPYGFSVDIVISAVFDINGTIHIEYAIDNEFGVQYKNGDKEPKVIKNRNSGRPSMELGAEAKAGIEIKAEISWLSEPRRKADELLSAFGITAGIVDAPIYSVGTQIGADVNAKSTTRKVICTDASLYLYWDIYVGEGNNILTEIPVIGHYLEHRWEIINEENCPSSLKVEGHFENLKKVDHCTYQQGKGNVEIMVTDLKNKPLAGVSLTLRTDTGIKKYSTDASGKVKSDISDGKYKCTAAKAGYKTLEKDLTVQNGKVISAGIRLAEGSSAEESSISTSVEEWGTSGDGTGGSGSGTGGSGTDEEKPVILDSDTWHGVAWSLDENYHLVVQGKPTLDRWSDAPWNRDDVISADLRGIDISKIKNLSKMFISSNLKSVDMSGCDMGCAKNMRGMFFECRSLKSVDLSGIDMGNVTDMGEMFRGCSSLTSLDLSDFDTGNVTDMSYMFSECRSLASLDLSSIDTGNVTDMSYMFNGCRSLTSLDLSSFDTGNVTDMRDMFSECHSLASLDLSSFDTGNVTDMYMFSECRSLKSIKVPKINPSGGWLYNREFKDANGKIYTSLPVTDGTSFEITRVGQ